MVSRRGFCFVDFLIIVAIVGILSAVAIPMYADYEKQKKEGKKGSGGKHRTTMVDSQHDEPGSGEPAPAVDKSNLITRFDHPETGDWCKLDNTNCYTIRELYLIRKELEKLNAGKK